MLHAEFPYIETLIPEEVIALRIKELGAAIAADFISHRQAESDVLSIVAVMDGAMDFVVALRKEIGRFGVLTRTNTVSASSYGSGTISSGKPNVQQSFKPEMIEGQYVVLADDLIDDGFTLEAVGKIVASLRPSVLSVVVLLAKVRRDIVKPRFKFTHEKVHTGFYVPKLLWIVGSGIDLAGLYRELATVSAVINNGKERRVALNYKKKTEGVGHKNWRP